MEFKPYPVTDFLRQIKIHISKTISIGMSRHKMANTTWDLRGPLKNIIEEITPYLLDSFYEYNNEKYNKYKLFCQEWEEYNND